MAELFLVQIVHGLIELFQKLKTLRRDASFDDPAIILLALAGDPTVFFHAIEQASHVRVARDHAFGDAAAEQAVGFGASKDAEDIVIGGGESSGLNEFFGVLGKGIGDFEDGHKELILKGEVGRRVRGHDETIIVITTIVKRKDSEPFASVPQSGLGNRAQVHFANEALRSLKGEHSDSVGDILRR